MAIYSKHGKRLAFRRGAYNSCSAAHRAAPAGGAAERWREPGCGGPVGCLTRSGVLASLLGCPAAGSLHCCILHHEYANNHVVCTPSGSLDLPICMLRGEIRLRQQECYKQTVRSRCDTALQVAEGEREGPDAHAALALVAAFAKAAREDLLGYAPRPPADLPADLLPEVGPPSHIVSLPPPESGSLVSFSFFTLYVRSNLAPLYTSLIPLLCILLSVCDVTCRSTA